MGGKRPRKGALKDWFTAQRDKMLAAKDFSGGNTSDKLASEYLGSHGIPGLKYFDGMSRGMTGDYIVRMPDGRRGASTYATKAEAEAATQMPSMEGSVVEAFSEPRTRNFVTWDQDVLNRMKLLERNGEKFDGLLGR